MTTQELMMYDARMLGAAQTIIENLMKNFYLADKGIISKMAYDMAEEWLACLKEDKLPPYLTGDKK